MKPKKLGYLQLSIAFILMLVGVILLLGAPSIADKTTEQTWPIWLASKFNGVKVFYMTLPRWVAFLSDFVAVIVLAIKGQANINAKPN